MSFLTDEEIKYFADLYRAFSQMGAKKALDAETKKQLARIERSAGKVIEALAGANQSTVDTLAALVRPDVSSPPGCSREDLQKFVNFASELETAAHYALETNGTIGRPRQLAPRMLALELFILFSKHFERFSATADGYGGVSEAVAALLVIAHRAGDTGMTDAAARKWIEFAQKRMPHLKGKFF